MTAKPSSALISECHDIPIILKELKHKSNELKIQIVDKLLLRQDLLLKLEKNKDITESLQNLKKEYDVVRSDLKRKLIYIHIASNKEKIIFRKKLDEFFVKRKNLEEQCRKLPLMFELENLICENSYLVEQCCEITSLLESTKKQYNEMIESLTKNFKENVCEFCDSFLKLNLHRH